METPSIGGDRRTRRSHMYMILFLAIASGDLLRRSDAFQFVPQQREIVYEYVGLVRVGAQAPLDTQNATPPPASGWKIRGTLKLQRLDNNTLSAALAVEKIILHSSKRVFYQNKEMLPVYNPFKIVTDAEDMVVRMAFKRHDPVWSRNFKRAIAAAIQLQGTRPGTFVTPEPSIHGRCQTEYYIAGIANGTLTAKKTTELSSCQPYAGGIHYERSNVPANPCEFDYQKNVIVGNEATYELEDRRDTDGVFRLRSVVSTGLTMVQTFESTGEAQYISSELRLNYLLEAKIVNPIDVTAEMTDGDDVVVMRGPSAPPEEPIDLTLAVTGRDHTGGRQTEPLEKLIRDAMALFGALTDSLERSDFDFSEPYDNRVADIIQVMGQMDADSVRRLYADIEKGTSYRQETIRNLFYEIIPRIGTRASVLMTRDLVVDNNVPAWTTIQMLMSLPFHIHELSEELVSECEKLLEISQNRLDVKEAGLLSFATLVNHAFNAGAISDRRFQRYVARYFDQLDRNVEYELKMVYMQGLGNLLNGKVADYVDPIIRDDQANGDLRFLAIIATMPLMPTHPERVFETYWPLFNNRNNTLELRVLAFSALLVSNPTPARLMSLHNVLREETCPHMKNFYRTTILSMSGTTHPCYQELKRVLSYMSRHIPPAEAAKYWATGQYLYDYRDQQYGIGAMLQNMLIADEQTGVPYIGIFEFQTEALGKFSSQLTLIIKARGIFDGISAMDLGSLNFSRPHEIIPKIAATLERLRIPSVKTKPFHLEVLIKSENKFVLSFYLNQKSIHTSYIHRTFKRIVEIALAGSHLNMQTIRWPFMLKYSVPTVLGTPAQVTIQSTVLASWRGNLTEAISSRSHDLDVRYSSYAVCKSTTYNPFLNLEHTINREQGFLVYLPLHSEVNMADWLNVTLIRPAGVRGAGASLKSRSITTTKGTILPLDKPAYNEVLVSDTSKLQERLQFIKYEMRDLGLQFTAGSTLMDVTNHVMFLVQSDIKENTKVLLNGNSVIDVFIMFAGILQLNAMHIGYNKNFDFLMHNDKAIRMESFMVLARKTFEWRVTHRSDDRQLLHYDLQVSLANSTELSFALRLVRTDPLHQTLETVVRGSWQYFSLTKRPYTLNGCVEFETPAKPAVGGSATTMAPIGAYGLRRTRLTPPAPLRSHINFTLSVGISEHSRQLYEENLDERCPREMLLFDPPPVALGCGTRDHFGNITMLSNYTLNVDLANMPEWYDEFALRLEHFVSTFALNVRMARNFSSGLRAEVNVQPDDLMMSLRLNDDQFQVPNVPRYLNQLRDVKYDSFASVLTLYGVKSMCSVVDSRLNSISDQHVDLDERTMPVDTYVLLLSYCSTGSEFVVAAKRLRDKRYALRVINDQQDIEYDPSRGADIVRCQSERNGTVKAVPLSEMLNLDDLLVLDDGRGGIVSYDMLSIFTLSRYNVNRERLCGLCNAPLNAMDSYVLADLRPLGEEQPATVLPIISTTEHGEQTPESGNNGAAAEGR